MEWLATLTEIVANHWLSKKQAYQLSKAMGDLSRAGVNFSSKFPGQKIKDAILEDGVAQLRLVRKPNHPLVWGLLPAEIINVDENSIWASSQEVSGSPNFQTPRYDKAIWTAFIKKIDADHRRFIFVEPPSRFLDIPIYDAPSEIGIELTSSYIIKPVVGELSDSKKLEVEVNIKRWCAANSVDPEKVLASSPRHDSYVGKSPNSFDIIDFSGLSSLEKSRILIPLDLISKVKFGR